MSTRAGILWALVVWAGFARLAYYAIWKRQWKRPTHLSTNRRY